MDTERLGSSGALAASLSVPQLDFLAHFASITPHKVAIRDLAGARDLTYAELDAAADKVAELLRATLSTTVGERVAVISRNRFEMVVLHFACIRTGAIFVPVNWRLAASEIEYILADCRPALSVVEPEFEPVVARSGVPRICLDESPSGLASRLAAVASPVSPCKVAVPADRPITLLYSSGTTGKPKGVIVTQINAWAGSLNLALDMHCGAESVFLCDMPLFHTAGLFAALRTPLSVGGAVVLSQKFDAEATYARLADRSLGITHYFSVTQMAMALRRLPGFDGRRLAHLQAFITGGAPNPAAHILRWLDDGVRMINAWGMSEICSGSAQPLGSLERLRCNPSSIGIPHLTLEVRLVDAASGRDADPGCPGEMWVRGLSVTPGYWQRPDLNEQAFRDGWFRTGDVAVRDSQGCYTLIDRIKDLFISGGENVYPAQIEAVIMELPEVTDVAVIGVADDKWGEVGAALVVVAAGARLDETAIRDHCAARLARFKIPRHVKIVSDLPRTPTGKVQKHLLRVQWR